MTERWTRERIDAVLRNVSGGSAPEVAAALRRTMEQVIDDLLADRDLLLAERDAQRPASTYRLPDELGGHECVIVREHENGKVDVLPAPWAEEGTELRLPKYRIVEVSPPSIDEPIDLPLAIRTIDGTGTVVVEFPPVRRADAGAALRILDWDIDADGARLLARAAWQRAAAVDSVSPAGAGTSGEGT